MPDDRSIDSSTTSGGDHDDLETAFGTLAERTGVDPKRPAEPRDWRSGAAAGRFRGAPGDWTWRDSARLVALIVAAAVFLVPAGLLLHKRGDESAAAAQQASAYTPPRLPAASDAARTGPVVAVVGDETAVRATAGLTAAQRWPALLGRALDSDVEVVRAVGGGYATPGDDGVTFVDAAADVPADADVVLVVGGSNDEAVSALSLTRGTTQAVSAASQRSSGAAVAVIGPVVTGGLPPEALGALRTTLAAGAGAAGVRWVDPVAAGWLTTPRSKATDLTAVDERTIATKLAAVVKQLAR